MRSSFRRSIEQLAKQLDGHLARAVVIKHVTGKECHPLVGAGQGDAHARGVGLDHTYQITVPKDLGRAGNVVATTVRDVAGPFITPRCRTAPIDPER
jgi:hypothetical protein